MGCINWAWKVQGLKSNEKVLLCAIADRADKDSGICSHPLTRLSRDCGGWSRQQTNRVLRRLTDYGLVDTRQKYPGTDDLSRLFIIQMMVDPDEWRPPKGEGKKPSSRDSYYVNSHDFYNLARGAMKSQKEVHECETYLAALQVIEVRKHILVCGLPSQEMATVVWDKYRDLLIQIAQKHVLAGISKLRLIYPKTQYSRPPKKKT